MQIWSSELKDIQDLLELAKDQFPALEKELEHLFLTDDSNVVLLYARRSLEIIVSDLCESQLKRPRKTEPLKGIIDKLESEGIIPANIAASMNGLNSISTFGVHPKDFDIEQVKPVLLNLSVVVKWYLKFKGVKLSVISVTDKTVTEQSRGRSLGKPGKQGKRRLIFLSVSLVLIIGTLILALFYSINLKNKKYSFADTEKSIAVLPFKNDSPDTLNTFFIDGLMEEILNNLQRIGDFRVISRTSVEVYRNHLKPISEIAKELGVNYIVEGSGQKFGNTIKLRVQLIKTKKEDHLWGNSYQTEISRVEDIFKLQNEIALAIASELQTVISPQEIKLISRKPTSNIDAWEAYLTGKFYLSKGTEKDFAVALTYFEMAKEMDPDFALAYSGIARVWLNRRQAGVTLPYEATSKAEAAIQKALELDSTLSDVHQSLAGIKTWSDWDWKGGEESYRKAIEVNPNNADARSVYSHLLNILGRSDEAMQQITIALKLDPFNSKIKAFYGIDLLFTRKYDEAVEAFRDALDIDPTQGVARINIFNALYLAGKEEEAMAALKSRFKDNQDYMDAINAGYAESGLKGTMRKLAELRAKECSISHIDQLSVAQYYTLAGDTAKAVTWIREAFEQHDPNLPYLLLPVYDELRNNVHFQEVAKKMNLPYK